MKLTGKMGFIGGGLMAEALIKGILKAGLAEAAQILAAEPNPDRRDILRKEYGVTVHESAEPLWDECALLILAVKPQVVATVLGESRSRITGNHLVVSIAAGISLAMLEAGVAGSGCRMIRVMPNTPAVVLKAASALSAGSLATDKDMELVRSIFDAIGVSVVLDEAYLDAVTGLSGSGPAYVFSFIEALIDAGLKVGLARPVARTLALQTVLGAAQLAIASEEHPAELRAMVTSPGGTTIAGLHTLERGAFQGLVMDAVEAATRRSRELGASLLSEEQK